jgi:pimeloyl-ACP methyl ester carboxylesterase
LPAIVVCSGFEGLKRIHPERFARALCPQGFAVLAFDYRGMGQSEGEYGRLVPQEWVGDVRAAVDRLGTTELVDFGRIGALGWALGGGVAGAAGAEDDRLKAVACVNGIGDGARSIRHLHTEEQWARLQQRIKEDRRHRGLYGRSELIDPWEIVPVQAAEDTTDEYVTNELYQVPGFGTGVTLESADKLMQFRPEVVAHCISPRPLLIVHGEKDGLHHPLEARSLYEAAREPKELCWLKGAMHTDFMHDDNPLFGQLIAKLTEFFQRL